MSKKLLVISLSVSLLFSILFFAAVFQVNTSALAETRRSALVKALSESQLRSIGAFPRYEYISQTSYFIERDYMNEHSTVDALLSLRILGGLNTVDIDRASRYLASKQYPRNGGYVLAYGYDGTILGFDLYPTYRVVNILKSVGHLDELNVTLLKDFVLERYDSRTGGFHELITQAYGRNYSLTSFPMTYPGGLKDDAYAVPNVISTFLGVSTLSVLGELSLINVTKTVNWIMSNQAANGMFKPFPASTYDFFPGWSPFRTNPFPVDSDGAGIPYTYAAVGSLKALGHMNTLSQRNREGIRDYILSCWLGQYSFRIHEDAAYASELFIDEYAFETLNYINMLSEATEPISNATSFLLQQQSLEFDNSWPIPNPTGYPGGPFTHYTVSPYALYRGEPDKIHRVLRILNITNAVSLLDQPTPRATVAQANLTILSGLVVMAACVTALGCTTIWTVYISKRRQTPQKQPPS